jgi:cytochrome c551
MRRHHGVFAALLAFSACNGEEDDSDRVSAILALTGDAANGELVYADECAVCHGADGEGGSGPSMSSVVGEGEDEIIGTVLEGEGSMPAFDDLPDQDIADLVAFITETF